MTYRLCLPVLTECPEPSIEASIDYSELHYDLIRGGACQSSVEGRELNAGYEAIMRISPHDLSRSSRLRTLELKRALGYVIPFSQQMWR